MCGRDRYQKNLQAGQSLELETSCLVAMTSGIAYSFRLAKNNHPEYTGESGLALATLKGPGSIWLQSISLAEWRIGLVRQPAAETKSKPKAFTIRSREYQNLRICLTDQT